MLLLLISILFSDAYGWQAKSNGDLHTNRGVYLPYIQFQDGSVMNTAVKQDACQCGVLGVEPTSVNYGDTFFVRGLRFEDALPPYFLCLVGENSTNLATSVAGGAECAAIPADVQVDLIAPGIAISEDGGLTYLPAAGGQSDPEISIAMPPLTFVAENDIVHGCFLDDMVISVSTGYIVGEGWEGQECEWHFENATGGLDTFTSISILSNNKIVCPLPVGAPATTHDHQLYVLVGKMNVVFTRRFPSSCKDAQLFCSMLPSYLTIQGKSGSTYPVQCLKEADGGWTVIGIAHAQYPSSDWLVTKLGDSTKGIAETSDFSIDAKELWPWEEILSGVYNNTQYLWGLHSLLATDGTRIFEKTPITPRTCVDAHAFWSGNFGVTKWSFYCKIYQETLISDLRTSNGGIDFAERGVCDASGNELAVYREDDNHSCGAGICSNAVGVRIPNPGFNDNGNRDGDAFSYYSTTNFLGSAGRDPAWVSGPNSVWIAVR